MVSYSSHNHRFWQHCVSALLASTLLAGCSTLGLSNKPDDLDPNLAKRETILAPKTSLQPSAGVESSEWIKLPTPILNAAWAQPAGNAMNVAGHPALGKSLSRAWRSSIGSGSDDGLRLLARPLIVGDKVYAMAADGQITALALANGDKLWQTTTQPEDGHAASGGGIAVADDKLFATTGQGEVLALAISDGRVLWRRKLNAPLRAAPVVAEGRVFAITINNNLTALNASDGAVLWTHAGATPAAALLGAANPAVVSDTVIAAYSSGEIYALRAQNGRVAWGDVLVTPRVGGALPEMADIRGAPVVDDGGVFALSQSGRMVAIINRTGERAWEQDIGGSNTPALGGNTLFVVTREQQLVALRRDNGKVLWTQALPARVDEDDKESTAIIWTGPVLAGGRLFLVNSKHEMAEYDALTGKAGAVYELPDAAFIAPIVAQNTLLVVADDGTLTAWR